MLSKVQSLRWVRQFAWAAAAIVLLLAGSETRVFAQRATGTLTGTVTDAKGAAMAGVSVTIHNEDTGIDTQEKTNDSGVYTAPLLQPGTYDVTSSQTGFATVQNKGITVEIGSTVRIDVQMPVASQQSLVTVTTEAPLIETEKTESSQTVSERLVTDLPISSRRWEQFVMLTPGLTTDGATGLIAFHGINSLYNSNNVDGASNDNSGGAARGGTNDGYIYSTDSIKEFQVASSNYNAEIGHSAGASVNAVTKSGTNNLHGDLFYNIRNQVFNALDPVNKTNATLNSLGATQPIHQQNQFGGSAGGPLLKDKLFVFITYDGYRKATPIVFTTAAGTGGTNPIGSDATFSGAPGTLSELACPLVITAAQCLAAKTYLNHNLGNAPRVLTQDIALAKVDYQLNQSNHLNATFNWRNWHEPVSSAFASVSGGSSSTAGLDSGFNSFLQDRFFIATWNTVIGTDKVNQVLYQYGVDNNASTNITNPVYPAADLSNIVTVGLPNSTPPKGGETRNQLTDNFSFTKGRHSFKTGVDLDWIHTITTGSNSLSGFYTYSAAVPLFSPLGTVGCGAAQGVPAASVTENAIFCDWLVDVLHVPTTTSGGAANTGMHFNSFQQNADLRFPVNVNGQLVYAAGDNFDSKTFSGYFQDTWKALPNLTINYGLRYDVQVLPQPTNPNSATPLLALYTSTINIDYGGIQPRVGLAWNFGKKNVVRLGFGTFFANTSTNIPAGTRRTSGLRELVFNCSPGASCANGPAIAFPNVLFDQTVGVPTPEFPGAATPQVLPPATNPCATAGTAVSCALRGLSPSYINPRVLEGELAFERQLPGNMSFTATYALTRGEHLPTYKDTNLAPATQTKTYDVVSSATGNGGATVVPNYTVPLFTSRIDATGAILTAFSNANSWYNGMILTVRKPMSHGVELLANYTFSKALDDGQASSNNGGEGFFSGPPLVNPYNLRGEYGLSGVDVRNRFTASVVWAPAYAKNLPNRYERGVLGGWNLSTAITATNGNPYSGLVQSSAVQSAGGFSGVDGGMTGAALNFNSVPAGGRVAWLQRDSYTLPSYTNVDLRLTRQFTIRERYNFQFRAEAFNLFNSTIIQAVNASAYTYAAPGAAGCVGHTNTCMVPLSTFQTPTTTSGNLLGARQMQFGFKFEF